MNFLGSFLSAIKPRNDDDSIDRLNYYYTCVIILVLSITISAKQYVGAPIQCWVPAQFTGAWEQYAENFCFVQNTYWLPLNDHIPTRHVERDQRQIGYYQWVPFILAMEAVFFYVPCIFWRQMNWQSGIDILSIIKMAGDTENIHGEARAKAVNTITQHLEDSIALQESFSKRTTSTWRSIFLQFGKAKGYYVTFLYVATKMLYILNVAIQFLVMNDFLGQDNHLWGLQILYDLANGREWEESGNFPRVTLCDFE
uniref:Innexin n=1 Tax=Plectus sambesii TaxID=2011161 RepID=A0A914V7N6_9BILA